MYVYLIIYMLRFLACSYRCEDSLAVVGRHFYMVSFPGPLSSIRDVSA